MHIFLCLPFNDNRFSLHLSAVAFCRCLGGSRPGCAVGAADGWAGLRTLLPVLAGELFAQAPVDQFPGTAVESVTDSSRYFVVRIEDGNGMCGVGVALRGFSARTTGLTVALPQGDGHLLELALGTEVMPLTSTWRCRTISSEWFWGCVLLPSSAQQNHILGEES